MKNHSRYYSLSLAINPLTRINFTSSIKSLTTYSGLSQPSYMRFFCAYLMAQLRHFYDGLSVPNTIPFEGISTAACKRLVITRRPYLNGVTLSKLKLTGVHNYA